jgi:GDP-L-fucose synthase
MNKTSRIFIAGHKGLVGSAIKRQCLARGFTNLIERDRRELDLCDGPAVADFFAAERPEVVYFAAAIVGGIVANDSRPAEFIRDNLLIQTNLIDSAWRYGVRKFLFLGSSCIYPKLAPQPLKEEYLLTGPLESTNEWYAVAKIAGVKACQAYRRQYRFNAITALPTNLYGPGDNFDLQSSHVVPALIRKIHEAKVAGSDHVVIWGTGTPMREFMHVDDLAAACLFLMDAYDDERPINVGWGEDLSIAKLAKTIASVVRFEGELVFDTSKPDGTPRRVLDTSRLTEMGWRPQITLRRGLEATYDWFVTHIAT